MSLDKRKQAFITLGQFLSQFTTTGILKKEEVPFNDLFFEVFTTQIKRAEEYNSWFTQNNVLFAFDSWAKTLTKESIEQWLQDYNIQSTSDKTIAVIMAGNIPLVGFHDFLCVAITGNKVLAKLSSNDKYFIPLIAKYLEYVEPSFKGTFNFTEEKLQNYDAVIATGSNNTARYFDYYFGKHPHIIRKSRNSVAVLDGNETHEQLENLSDDIFRYYGLGCRNVSKIFIPRNYDFDKLFKAVYKHKDILNYTKYANNYDYNKAVYLMSLFDIKENGFLMLKEDKSYASPIASLFYEFYDDFDSLKTKLKDDSDKVQCITSELNIEDSVKFGQTQLPKLWNYADNVDTVNFLITL
ncbi:acyl-CoA reductase [Wenyingzhuangia marina]|uniref:Acyl-CoA reductase (LuxC) n=1 Tax=Wenyingzhuangia marina TaxID=1195760 RepID=A0A1M5VKA2_9FLAO|nr:acyl-CoA reductase [Wenyingzhuangia marina]GGF71661.1 acyl-CoA reductase [Wenyingzhuangia marina]SHH75637.1 Acyl-CoA reductase (LuxC) [Wenyingzhuangia marina]